MSDDVMGMTIDLKSLANYCIVWPKNKKTTHVTKTKTTTLNTTLNHVMMIVGVYYCGCTLVEASGARFLPT